MERIDTHSTSARTAEASPIVLREGPLTRLVFVPTIVDNTEHPLENVRGAFVYEKKGKKDEWLPIDRESLSSIKIGDRFKLELSSHELFTLRERLYHLGKLGREEGVPRGEQSFVRARPELAHLLELRESDFDALLSSDSTAAVETFLRLLKWISGAGDVRVIADRLAALTPDELPSVTSIVNLAALKGAVATWEANRENSDEQYWQRLLERQTAVLSQLFAYPIVIIKAQAYLGGKAVDNTGGKLADFLGKIASTGGLLIVEIKTPGTPLLGKLYRGVRPMSSDVSGAIAQCLHYRQALIQEYRTLTRNETSPISLGEPRCVVIAGDAARELTSEDERNSFELLRESLRGVTVVTFDELFMRARNSVGLMEAQS